MDTLLIIDDEPGIRQLLSRIMELEAYTVLQAANRAQALDILAKNSVNVILCDVFLPDGNGVKMIPELLSISPKSKIIMLTAHGNIADGVQAIKSGAFDYIVKGDDNFKIIPVVSRAITEQRNESEGRDAASVKAEKQKKVRSFDSVSGSSQVLMNAVNMAKKVANTDVPVLLTGETGTGKEVFAHAIHNASSRRDREFVAVNCSAFSIELLESELFGHKAGSFTGASKDKKGLFEIADKGTIFLDEIGEMEYNLQAKLLRVLESGEFIKVGDTKVTKVDVRIISATNRELKREIEKKSFREDLYFRLSVFEIKLPPLRERSEDIEALSKDLMKRLEKSTGRKITEISPEALKMMKAYKWPGNIRELKNVLERAMIVCDDVIRPGDFPVQMQIGALSNSVGASADSVDSLDLASMEKNHIIKVLQHTSYNKTETARLLKIGLSTLYRKIEEYGIVLSK